MRPGMARVTSSGGKSSAPIGPSGGVIGGATGGWAIARRVCSWLFAPRAAWAPAPERRPDLDGRRKGDWVACSFGESGLGGGKTGTSVGEASPLGPSTRTCAWCWLLSSALVGAAPPAELVMSARVSSACWCLWTERVLDHKPRATCTAMPRPNTTTKTTSNSAIRAP